MSILFITHDLGVVAEIAARVVVMYAGRVVEAGAGRAISSQHPRHPYTRGLLRLHPERGRDRERPASAAAEAIPGNVPSLIAPAARLRLRAALRLRGIDALPSERPPLAASTPEPAHAQPLLEACRAMSGRTTAPAQRAGPDEAFPGAAAAHRPRRRRRQLRRRRGHDRRPGRRIRLRQDDGRPLRPAADRADRRARRLRRRRPAHLSDRAMRAYRRRMQIVFQDPFSSLNPRMRVDDIIGEAIDIHGLAPRRGAAGADRRVARHASGLPPSTRALSRTNSPAASASASASPARSPSSRNSSSPTSRSPPSTSRSRRRSLNLLQDLQQDLGLTMLFIAHDLAVVEYLCDDVVVMYLGRIMETRPSRGVYARPRHPYTQALLSAAPVPDPTAPARPHRAQGRHPEPARIRRRAASSGPAAPTPSPIAPTIVPPLDAGRRRPPRRLHPATTIPRCECCSRTNLTGVV